MSLLMEALKKAERAKQGQGEPAPASAPAPVTPPAAELELSLQPQEPPAAEPAPMPELVLDIEPAQPLPRIEPGLATPEPTPEPAPPSPSAPAHEAVAAQPIEQPAPSPRTEPTAKPTPRPQAPAASRTPARGARDISDAQHKARTVFTAKAPADHRKAMIAGAAAVLALGLGGFGFYYWQLIAGSSVAPPGLAHQPMTAPAPAVEAAAPAAVPPPAAARLAEVTEKPTLPPAGAEAAAPLAVAGEPEAPRATPAIQIRQSSTPSQLNPSLSKAYQAYQAGDADAAQQHYQKVLQQDANNRDALLGLAAVALNRKQPGQAAALYARLLELDPADPDALAGLIGTQGQADPVQSETRLKKILVQNPQAAAVHFALGNVYSQQSRWAEAQQSYFRAYSSTPGNADYAFNLAVSLDSLSQGKLAQEYYQRALNLAKSGPANFDRTAASTRIKELHTTFHGLQPVDSRSPSGQQPAGE